MGPSTLASWALLIARALRERGLDADALFRSAGLKPVRLRDAGARYPVHSMARLWKLAADATADSAFGLEVGRLWHPTTFHALGYAALASATLREALSYVARYCDVVTTGARLVMSDQGAKVAFRLESRMTGGAMPSPAAPIAAQAGLAAIVTLCREARGAAPRLQAVSLAQRDDGCRARMEAFFDCAVAFGTRDNALVFRARELDAPLPGVNRDLVRINRRLLNGYLASLRSQRLADRVRAQLIRLLPLGEPDQVAVAKALDLSRRSLQRQLQKEGMSFRRLLDATRAELAREYLNDRTMSGAEIAYLLGFAETSSLSRAMRRWRLRRS